MSEISLMAPVEFSIEENVVRVSTDRSTSVYTLPRSAARVVMTDLGDDRSRLVIGGFKSVTVSVVGPTRSIKRLWEGVTPT